MDIVTRQRINLLIQLADLRSIKSKSPVASIVKRVARECDFPDNELNQLLKSPEPIGTFGALSPNQRAQYVFNLGEVMANIELDTTKVLMCHKLAYDLGYSKKHLNTLVAKLQHENNSTSANKEEVLLRITA